MEQVMRIMYLIGGFVLGGMCMYIYVAVVGKLPGQK